VFSDIFRIVCLPPVGITEIPVVGFGLIRIQMAVLVRHLVNGDYAVFIDGRDLEDGRIITSPLQLASRTTLTGEFLQEVKRYRRQSQNEP
jgi:hypothetical protein